MSWLSDKLDNVAVKMLNTTVQMQKVEINKLKDKNKSLEKLLTTVMLKQGYTRAQVFAAIHTGELVDNTI